VTESEDSPALIVQTEQWEEGDSPYLSLTSRDLSNLADVMADLLASVGVKAKDRVLIYDFNTSISTLAMSRVFTPGLSEGVCERLECIAICTDGLSELAARSAYTFGLWQPEVLLIRSELASPFLAKLQGRSLQEADPNLRTVVAIHNDVVAWPRQIGLGPGRFEKRILCRVDPALFMCLVKPCGGIYYPRGRYRVDLDPESGTRLRVAPAFSPGRGTLVSNLEATAGGKDCGCGEGHEFVTEAPGF